MPTADVSDPSRQPEGGAPARPAWAAARPAPRRVPAWPDLSTRLLTAAVLALLAAVTAPAAAVAQQAKPAPQPASQAKQPQAPAPAGQAALAIQPQMPDHTKLAIMIQNTLLALNQANLTGNYSVMRDLATPSFQAANSPAQLAENFADLRKRKIDLSPLVLFQPKLVRQPAIDDKGLLRLVGFFDTKPEQVQFELLFAQVAAEQWRLFGLGVQTVPAPTAQAQPSAAPAKKEADAAPAKKK